MTEMTFRTGRAPGGRPLIGHLWLLRRQTGEFLASLPRYGDLVQIRLGPVPAFVPCHPEVLRQVLTDDRTFDKGGAIYDRMRGFLGNGLASCPHADHRRQRRALQSMFRAEGIKHHSAPLAEGALRLTGGWMAPGPVDVYAEFYRFALHNVLRLLVPAHADDPVASELRRTYEILISATFRQLLMPGMFKLVPLPGARAYHRAITDLRQISEQLLKDHATATGNSGVIAALCRASQETGATVTVPEVQDQFITMLAGGSESSAATLAWACCLLAQHPEYECRLRAEADEVLSDASALPGGNSSPGFTGRFITEVQRLYPPVWMLTRKTTVDTNLAGRHLPRGTTMLISAYPLHRNPEIFSDPEVFDPDRWLPERAVDLPRGAFAAFGGGPRKCIGDVFAMTEIGVAIAAIVRQWKLSLAPQADLRPATGTLIIRPAQPLINLSPRHATDDNHATWGED